MDKITSMSINELLIGELILIASIAIIVLICVLVKANKTLKKVDKILDDASVVSGFAAKQTEKIDGIVTGVEDTVTTCVENIKNSNGIVKAAAGVVNAATSLVGLIKNSDEASKDSKDDK